MPETFLVPFDYTIHLPARYGIGERTALRRDTAAIEVPVVRLAEMPVAYQIAHTRDLGPGRHLILRKDGRLWWPLADGMFGFNARDAVTFLRELRGARSDLFIRRSANDPRLQHHARRRVVYSAREETLAAVHRSAASLLIVDDLLYAAGGVPLLVDTAGGAHLASTGADRAVRPAAGDLRIKPANGHRGGIDLELSRGRFYLPGSAALAHARRCRFELRDIRIEAVDGGDDLDPPVVRIDAAFRAAGRAMVRSIPRTRPELYERLCDQFARASRSDQDEALTAARYFALYNFAQLFGPAEPKPVAVRECLDGVRDTLNLAASRFRHLPLEDLRPSLTEVESAALNYLLAS